MHKLSTRCHRGAWEVLIPNGALGKWVRCRHYADAHRMAVSGNLAFDALERVRTGDEIVQELQACADLFGLYGCNERAAWLLEHAKFARGERSLFDEPLAS